MLQITFFLLQRAGEWGQKHCRSSVKGGMAIGPHAGTLFFVKHSSAITMRALPDNDFRGHGMRPGMFHGDDRLALLSPEGSLAFLGLIAIGFRKVPPRADLNNRFLSFIADYRRTQPKSEGVLNDV
jgi:hypothetical protein